MNSSSQVLIERLNKVCSEYVREVVMECGKLYGFEGSEALSRLGLSEIPLLEKVEQKVSENVLAPLPLLEKVEQKVSENVLAPPFPKVEVVEKKEKVVEKKGRPKKSKKELEVQGEDLFAELIFSAQNPVLENPLLEKVEQNAVESPLVAVLDVVPEVLVPLPLLEKVEEKKVEVEEKKVEKKVVVSKGEKEALKAAKEAEKAAKEAEKASKEAEKAALKEKKEAEKMLKKGDKKPVKKAKKVSEEVLACSEGKVSSEILAPPLVKVEVEVEEEADVVKKFEYEGVKYLKSKKSGIIYNMEQEVVGKWNEESQKIDFEEEDDSSDEEE